MKRNQTVASLFAVMIVFAFNSMAFAQATPDAPIRPRFILRQAMIWILLVTVLGVGWYPSEANAMLAPAQTTATEESSSNLDRAQDLEMVQRVLEHKLIRQRLEDLGLSPEEAHARLDGLSDAQLHQLAMQIESLIPGGLERELGLILTVLLIILVAVIIVILI